MIVSSILQIKSTDLVTATPNMTIHETAKLLARHKIGAVVVKEMVKWQGLCQSGISYQNLVKLVTDAQKFQCRPL